MRTKIILPNGNDLQGVIHYLQVANKRIKDQIIKINSTPSEFETIKWGVIDAIIDYNKAIPNYLNNWCSQNIANSNFTIYFPRNKVQVTNYSILSRNIDLYSMLQTWKVEGSNNNETWSYIDHRINEKEITQLGVLKTYAAKNIGTYKYFRFTQNGTSTKQNNHFCLCKVDLFGVIFGNFPECSRPISRRNEMNCAIFLIIFMSVY